MRLRLTVTYDGTGFAGFQHQPQTATVQSELERALHQVLGEAVRITASGRTDAGVHALMQPCHIDLTSESAISRANKPDFLLKLNAVLSPRIAVRNAHIAKPQSWNARESAKKKTYVYVILIAKHRNPHLEGCAWRMHEGLDLRAMKRAAKLLIGTHDFSAFCGSGSSANSPIRTLKSVHFSKRNPFGLLALPGDKFITVSVTGTGFLKHMVRNIVGTLAAVGADKFAPTHVKTILKSRDRRQAGVNAPAQGLYLLSVDY